MPTPRCEQILERSLKAFGDAPGSSSLRKPTPFFARFRRPDSYYYQHMRMKKHLLFFCVSLGLLATGCNKEGPKKLLLDKISTQLYQSETSLITSNGTNVTYQSRNPYVATVDDEGLVTANFVGETIIDVKADEGKAEFKVTVNGKYHTFDEPCHDWTKTRSQVFAMHPTLSFSESGDYWMAIVDDNRAMLLQYGFDSSNKLISAAITISQDYAVQSMYFLSERYLPVTSKDGAYYFVNGITESTVDTIVSLSKITGYKVYMIVYLPYIPTKAEESVARNTPIISLPDKWKE